MSDERNSSSPAPSDPLDDWLAQARWPEPTAISTERLRVQWRDLRRPRRWSISWTVAAAAAVVLATTMWMTMRSPHRVMVTLDPFAQPAVAAPLPPPRLVGREMTGLEKTLLDAQARKAAKAKSPALASARPISKPVKPVPAPQSVPQPPPQEPAPVVALQPAPPIAIRPYLERVNDAGTRSAALAELDGMKSPPTEQLLGYLSGSRADLRVAAALALGRIDGPVLTHRLIEMVAADQNRREAFIALAASRGAEAQSFIRQAAASQNLSGLARSTLSMNELQ